MTVMPKPPKRERKPPKRISRSPIARRSAPRKKRKGKRASIARECDRLWSLIVKYRAGGCEECKSPYYIQAAHGISRRYRATRWLPINGFALCRKHHVFWTHRPLEWTEWLRTAWGEPAFRELHELALKNARQDMPAVLANLRAEATAVGIP